MMRLLFIGFFVLLLGFLFLQGRLHETNNEKPVYMRTDEIAKAHQTKINCIIHSLYQPDSFQLETLQKDYSNIWAHLNHLYATNDVAAGKEYYTEGWFKQICKQYNGIQKPIITRTDEQHDLQIENWSSDGLICTALDSNVVLQYRYPDASIKSFKANIAVVLLFQGDHWRIDALRVLSEGPLK
jgi:hypothetical protein